MEASESVSEKQKESGSAVWAATHCSEGVADRLLKLVTSEHDYAKTQSEAPDAVAAAAFAAAVAWAADNTVGVVHDMLVDTGKVEDTTAADNVDTASSAPWADSIADSSREDSCEAAHMVCHVCADVDEVGWVSGPAHRAACSGSCWFV